MTTTKRGPTRVHADAQLLIDVIRRDFDPYGDDERLTDEFREAFRKLEQSLTMYAIRKEQRDEEK